MTDNCYCDFDPPQFYSATQPRARKRYRCDECPGFVEVGERYERAAGKWDDLFGVFITCERCYDLRTWITNNVPCFCWAHGGAFEDAKETIRDAWHRAPGETQGLMFGYYRRIILRDRRNGTGRAFGHKHRNTTAQRSRSGGEANG